MIHPEYDARQDALRFEFPERPLKPAPLASRTATSAEARAYAAALETYEQAMGPFNAALTAHRERQAVIDAAFLAALGAEYLSDAPKAVWDVTGARAWQEGHSSGYSGVENSYIELADFVRKVMEAAR